MTTAASPSEYLARLADYLEAPDDKRLDAIVSALKGAGVTLHELPGIGTPPLRQATGAAWIEAGMSGDSLARGAVEAWAGALGDGEETTWAALLQGFLVDPESLDHGVGARLKALSPFAGMALVTVEPRYGHCDLGGDVSALFGLALMGAGHDRSTGGKFLVALDRDCLVGARVVPTRPPRGT